MKLCLCAVFGMFPLFASAQGDLMITPRRVVLEGNKQIEEILVANIGRDTAFYSVSLVEYNMTEDGRMEKITEPLPGQKFASPLLRYFPRAVELAPRESQVVRIQVRRLPNPEEGEYRSHLYFKSVPKSKPLGEENTISDTTTIGVRLTPIYGISIPVIVRIGNLSATLSISELALEKQEGKPPVLKMVLNREGNKSVYGDIAVDYVAPGKEPLNVGLARGVAVYTPNTIRRFALSLTLPDEMELNTGKLIVRFTDAERPKGEVLDEKELILP
ncbi:MAG TPA: hypothetical protein PLQ60_07830 [Paludibacteraceae bacterium]|nr:hypothetical protein [Paludibacteraceae bacterium]